MISTVPPISELVIHAPLLVLTDKSFSKSAVTNAILVLILAEPPSKLIIPLAVEGIAFKVFLHANIST